MKVWVVTKNELISVESWGKEVFSNIIVDIFNCEDKARKLVDTLNAERGDVWGPSFHMNGHIVRTW